LGGEKNEKGESVARASISTETRSGRRTTVGAKKHLSWGIRRAIAQKFDKQSVVRWVIATRPVKGPPGPRGRGISRLDHTIRKTHSHA